MTGVLVFLLAFTGCWLLAGSFRSGTVELEGNPQRNGRGQG